MGATHKRITITLDDELENALFKYIRSMKKQYGATPSLAAIGRHALREFLAKRGFLRPERPRGPGSMEVRRDGDRAD